MEHRMTALETRLDTVLPTLATKADLAKGTSDLVKWIVGIGIAGVAIILSVLTFYMNAAKAPAPAVQSAPNIIINVPPLAPALPPPAAKR
jgi:hypothetical protein